MSANKLCVLRMLHARQWARRAAFWSCSRAKRQLICLCCFFASGFGRCLVLQNKRATQLS